MTAQNQLPNLDKIFQDDDEPDFMPSGGSNLAAIFGLQAKPSDAHLVEQTSLKKSGLCNTQQHRHPRIATSSKTEVSIAKAVYAFKLQNGQYVSMGKLGMALTGNVATRIYQLILYRGKQDYVSVATVTRDFVYTVGANNYTSYYDNDRENWSILFESDENYLEFAIEIGLARYFAIKEGSGSILYQDLTPSDREYPVAKGGDNVHIKYFVGVEIARPLETNFTMSQATMVQISSTDDNWERILIGGGKGLRRMLFLPPRKQISLGPGFPKERDIMLIIEIIDVRSLSEESLPVSKNWTSERASIISRMAKMGQSIVPKIPLPSTTDSEDTEDDVPHSPRYKRVDQSEATVGRQRKSRSNESSEEKNAVETIAVESRTQVPSTIHRTVPAALDPGRNTLLSEIRITNAEIRMGISKLSDNVQKLLDKFHTLELGNATIATSDKATLDTSWKVLQTLDASHTEERNKKELSTSTDNNIRDENIREAWNKMSALESDVRTLTEEKESLLLVNVNLTEKVEELGTRLTNANGELTRVREELEVARNTIERYKEDNVNLENRLSECKKHLVQVDGACREQQDMENKKQEIKQIMNETYHTLLERLAHEAHSDLSFDHVKSIIAHTIKPGKAFYRSTSSKRDGSREYEH